MTCASIARAILSAPDLLIVFGLLFTAAVFGAAVMCVYYEIRIKQGWK